MTDDKCSQSHRRKSPECCMQILSKRLSTKLHCSRGCQLAQHWKLNTRSEALRIFSSKLYDFQVQRCCKTHMTLGITTQFILLQQKQCVEKVMAQSVSVCREYQRCLTEVAEQMMEQQCCLMKTLATAGYLNRTHSRIP